MVAGDVLFGRLAIGAVVVMVWMCCKVVELLCIWFANAIISS